MESIYFGWNLIPQSGTEIACDGIALLMLMVARIADSALRDLPRRKVER